MHFFPTHYNTFLGWYLVKRFQKGDLICLVPTVKNIVHSMLTKYSILFHFIINVIGKIGYMYYQHRRDTIHIGFHKIFLYLEPLFHERLAQDPVCRSSLDPSLRSPQSVQGLHVAQLLSHVQPHGQIRLLNAHHSPTGVQQEGRPTRKKHYICAQPIHIYNIKRFFPPV